VGKTNVAGTLLTEAKYINLSLHYLEQVSNKIVGEALNVLPLSHVQIYAFDGQNELVRAGITTLLPC